MIRWRKESAPNSSMNELVAEQKPMGMRTRARSHSTIVAKFVEKPEYSMHEDIEEEDKASPLKDPRSTRGAQSQDNIHN